MREKKLPKGKLDKFRQAGASSTSFVNERSCVAFALNFNIMYNREEARVSFEFLLNFYRHTSVVSNQLFLY